MITWWLSNSRMTVRVRTDDNHVIVETAPIVRKFRGQPLENLTRWLRRMGDTKVVKF
jgi:hypothetical protein